MENKKLNWCFKLKDGLKIVEPNERLSKSYLEQAKCENHACSILATTVLLGEDKTRTINLHKDKRIDAQYYMKVDQETKIRAMLQEAKMFVSNFDEIISNLTEADIKKHRNNIK